MRGEESTSTVRAGVSARFLHSQGIAYAEGERNRFGKSRSFETSPENKWACVDQGRDRDHDNLLGPRRVPLVSEPRSARSSP